MRKLKTLFLSIAMLTAVGTAWAQPTVVNDDATTISTDKYYYLRNRGRGMKYLNEQINGYMALSSAISDYWITYIVRFEADGENYKVKLWNDKYLTNSGQSQAVYAGDADNAISVSASYTAANQWAFKNLTNNLYFNGNADNFVYWGGSQDAGNGSYYVEETDLTAAQFKEAAEALKIVTFNITKLDGTTTSSTGFFLAGTTPVVPADAVENLADYTFTQDGDNYNFVASSQLSTDFASAKWYNMVIRSAINYVYYSTNEPYTVNKTATKAQLASAPYQWALIGDMTNGVKMVNKATGENYTLTANGNNAVLREGQTTWDIDVNNNTVTINDQAIKGFVLKVAGSEQNYINQNGGDNGTFQFWNSGNAKNDQGSTMFFVEAPELETYNVTYNVKYNGKTVKSAVSAIEEGSAIGSAIPAELEAPFVTLTAGWDAAQTVTADTEVDVNATWNGPVTLNESVADATWQNLAVRGNYYVTSGNKDADGALKPILANALGLVEDAYQWAFVGDPYHIQLFNKAETNNFGYDGDDIPSFQETETFWTLKQSTSSIANSYMLTVPGTNQQLNQSGSASGPLKFWNYGGTADDGSAFTIFDVPTNFAEYVVAEIVPYFESAKYFVLNNAAKETVGYNESFKTECLYADYKKMKEVLPTVVANLNNYVLPETGYYRMKNQGRGGYMGNVDGQLKGYVGTHDTDASTVVLLTKKDDTYSIQVQGLYVQEAAQSAPVAEGDAETIFKVSVPAPGVAGFSVTGEGNTFLHKGGAAGADAQNIVGWTINEAASRWIVEDAESINVPISAASYATLNVPFAVEVPEEVAAYTGTINGDYLTLNAVEAVIPANTPVVLNANVGTYTFSITENQTAIEGNDLQGTLTAATVANALTLQVIDDQIGFYTFTGTTIPANKAYLVLGSEVKGLSLSFGETDGVTSIATELPEGENIYNLAGQRVSKATKGIYIINGRKVVVK